VEERIELTESEVKEQVTKLNNSISKKLEFTPAFNGIYGWLSIAELNVIDPEARRFDIVDDYTAEDGSVFVKVVYA
jgi:hypothetical protein